MMREVKIIVGNINGESYQIEQLVIEYLNLKIKISHVI